MYWIDMLLIAIILLSLWGGWQRGFISSVLSLLSWAGSFAAGYFLYPFAAGFITRFTSALGEWTLPAGFIGIVIIARIFLNAISNFLLRQISIETHEHVVNKIFGLFPGFANGLIRSIVVAALLLAIPFQNTVSDKARESRLATAIAPPAFALVRELAPIFSEPLRNSSPKSTVKPGATEFVKLPYTVTNPDVRENLEVAMLLLVNEERKKERLKPVVADPEMRTVARAHSKDMFARGYFAHVNPDGKDPFDRMRVAGVKFRTAGENLALAQTLQQAHDGLMKSPGHRANILQPRFGRLGIGISDGGIYGLMVTQNFRN